MRLIGALLTFVCAAFAGTAYATNCEKLDAISQLRFAIVAKDTDRAYRLTSEVQSEFEAGTRPADDTRCLVWHLSKTHPDIIEFVDLWLDRDPRNPFALTAKARNLSRFGWDVRGPSFANQTHPHALAEFRRLQNVAWELADKAYRINPRLLPASDTIVELANANNQAARARIVTKRVLTTDPNIRSYSIARNQMLPGWRRTWFEVENHCADYAPLFAEILGEDPVLDCKLRASTAFPSKKNWMLETLQRIDRPELDFLRIDHLIRADASQEEAQRAFDYLSKDGATEVDKATVFDIHFSVKYDFPILSDKARIAANEEAKKQLEDDPFNLASVRAVVRPLTKTTVGFWGRLKFDVISRPSTAEMVDYDSRILFRRPFEPESWLNYQQALIRDSRVIPFNDFLKFNINAVYYGDHEIEDLDALVGRIIVGFNAYHVFRDETAGHTTEDLAKFSVLFGGIDYDRDILCPFIRATRVRAHMCARDAKADCTLPRFIRATFDTIEEDVARRDICKHERDGAISSLMYLPVEMPEID